MSAPAAPQSGGTSGTVVETMDAAGYTYVQVDSGVEKIWAAAPAFAVSVGDSVVVPEGMPMSNYHSKTLNRDFDVVYFVDSVLNASAPAMPAAASGDMPAGHPTVAAPTAAPEVDLSNIAKAAGGLTVSEVFADKANLSGKELTLRAKVVKFSPQIMGKNWLHVQDGSGDQAAATNDLTVTTNVTAQVGDTVLITGPLTVDKDFGYGYQYDAIIEDAKVTVE
jgi:ribosomal protein S17